MRRFRIAGINIGWMHWYARKKASNEIEQSNYIKILLWEQKWLISQFTGKIQDIMAEIKGGQMMGIQKYKKLTWLWLWWKAVFQISISRAVLKTPNESHGLENRNLLHPNFCGPGWAGGLMGVSQQIRFSFISLFYIMHTYTSKKSRWWAENKGNQL